MNRTLLPYLGPLGLALTVLPNAVAQNLCIPEAFGLPNLGVSAVSMFGAPMWWVPGGSTNMTRLDDPRWNGAVSQDINGEVTFRALHHKAGTTDTLFLSWQAKIDQTLDQSDVASNTTGDPTGDQLVVGFKQPTGSATIIHLGLGSSAAGQEANKAGVAYKAYTWDGMALTPLGPLPWIDNAKAAWTWEDAPNSKARWTFQIVVPISAMINSGVNISQSFNMFYAFLVEMKDKTFTEYRWPSGVSRIRNPTSGIVSYPDPTDVQKPWGQVSWNSSLTCAGDVALDANQIGVGNPPDNQIKFTYPPATGNNFPNQLTAKPQNISVTTQIAAGQIQADFFLSNYGSAIDDARFWNKISPSISPTNIAQMNPGDLGLIQPSPPFVVADADRCRYIDDTSICTPPPVGIRDKCILVQLSQVTPTGPSPTPPPPLVFRNQSVYNNMLFKPASTLRHRAQINVVGLKPLADSRTTRDVYLYVETVNMPAKISGTSPKPAVTATRDTLIVARRDTSLTTEWGVIRLAQGDSVRFPLSRTLLAPGASAGKRFAAVRRAAATGTLTVPEVDAQVPTFRIHAYHATGDSLGKLPILEPQTSFGYWVEHDGETIGWRYRIEGEHIVKLAPHYYKIEVPNNGRAIITTIIEALPWRPFALSLHGGISLPTGSLKTSYDRGFGITADAEYWFNRRFALQALFGYHRFGGKGTNPDLELFHASAGLEVRVTTGSPSLLVEGGGGTYHFKPGSTKPGTQAGASVEFDLSPRVSLGVNGRLHTVFTTGSHTTFYSVQAGGWIRL